MLARKSLRARGLKFAPDMKSSNPRFCSFSRCVRVASVKVPLRLRLFRL